MTYFEITNWDKYQNYQRNKSAPPPWFKVYTSILADPKTAALSDAMFGQLVRIWAVATLNANRLPFDPKIIQRIAGTDKQPDLELFMSLGLINLCAGCQQSVDNLTTTCNALSEKRREEKRREDTMSGKPDSIPYQEIVGLLNEVVGSRYRATSEATKRLIRARWKEGHRVPDFESVIRGRHALWAKDEKMAEYLRPSTLFGTKFESYLNANGVKAKRPIREVDRWA